ncbi:MAG: murein biosynthesis integral rane protein MurJ, partial [Actinomycetota bacterium]
MIMAAGTVASRILGFVRAVLLALTIGVTTDAADAFGVANQLPNNVYAIIAGGVLNAVLVPQIVKARAHLDGGQ